MQTGPSNLLHGLQIYVNTQSRRMLLYPMNCFMCASSQTQLSSLVSTDPVKSISQRFSNWTTTKYLLEYGFNNQNF